MTLRINPDHPDHWPHVPTGIVPRMKSTPGQYDLLDHIGNDKPRTAPGPVEMLEPKSVLDMQPGGDHYKGRAIQPVQYIHANQMNFFEGNVVKYITRHRAKNGAEDIRKAIHYLQMILELEYGKPPVSP